MTLFASVLAVLLALAGTTSAGEIVRHTGSIVAIAADASTFVLAEVGPWQVRNGATVMNDYVTVECRHEGKRLLALKITVVELGMADVSPRRDH